MTFILFVIGLAAITLIARYNESNTLFWKLFLSFLLGIAATGTYVALTSDKQDKEILTQVCPTQDQCVTLDTCMCLLANIDTESEDSCQPLASKVYAPAIRENLIALSKVFGRTRDQPVDTTSISSNRGTCSHDTS